jgi:hypothetical protein
MWRLFLACTPEPQDGECPETCDVSLEIVPPSGLTGFLTVRTDPPGYAFGGALLDPSGAEIRSVNGISEGQLEVLPGELVEGETYTLAIGYACEPGEAQPACRELEATFVAGAVGTGPTGTSTTTSTETGVTDVIVQVTTPKVDVLFVVDNSCSMYDEQDELTSAFPSFMAYFEGSGLDYHIGVTSTDIDGNYNGSKGKLVQISGDRWIDDDTTDPQDTFTAMASMGTGGSGNEKGLGAVYQALEINRATSNQGFLRDDSGIHVVVLSDEPDLTPPSVISQPEFVQWFDSLRNEADDRTFSSIVGPLGTRYEDTTAAIGGVLWDITAGDFPQLLERLGVQAAGLKREYFLSQVPVPDTVEVSVEDAESGATLTFARDDDWTYSPDRNSVLFLTYIPNAGSSIVIHYLPAD